MRVFIDIFTRSHLPFESSAVIVQAPPTASTIGGLLNMGVTCGR